MRWRAAQHRSHAGHQKPHDPEMLVVTDTGYDVVRLAWLLQDLPVIVLGRLRLDRVFYCPAGQRKGLTKGRGPRHGNRLALRDSATQTDPTITTTTATARYGCAAAMAFARMHPKIDARAGWKHYKTTMDQPPIIEGTVIWLTVERLPGDRHPKPGTICGVSLARVPPWISRTSCASCPVIGSRQNCAAMGIRSFGNGHHVRHRSHHGLALHKCLSSQIRSQARGLLRFSSGRSHGQSNVSTGCRHTAVAGQHSSHRIRIGGDSILQRMPTDVADQLEDVEGVVNYVINFLRNPESIPSIYCVISYHHDDPKCSEAALPGFMS